MNSPGLGNRMTLESGVKLVLPVQPGRTRGPHFIMKLKGS